MRIFIRRENAPSAGSVQPAKNSRAASLFRNHEIMVGQRTEKLPYTAVSFKAGKLYRVVSRQKRELVDGAVGVHDRPAAAAHIISNLREPLAAVKRLVVFAVRMTKPRVK